MEISWKSLVFLSLSFIILGCQSEVSQTVVAPGNGHGCAAPLIADEDSCCMDRDSDGLCDTDETQQTAQTGTQGTGISKEDEGQSDASAKQEPRTAKEDRSAQKEATLFGSILPYSANSGFLSAMEKEKTLIAFDSGKTTGSMVLSALHLKLFLNNPENLDVLDHVEGLTGQEEKDVLASHLILLGNGCTNSMIKEIEKLTGEGCKGTEKGKGILKFYTQAGKRIMVVIGYDDEDIYALEKKIVAGEIIFSGTSMEVVV